jgi:hypothetical protein
MTDQNVSHPPADDPEGLGVEPDPADVEWFATQARARSVSPPDPYALLMLRPLAAAREKYGPDMTLADAYHSEPESIGTPEISLREALRIYGDGCTLAEAVVFAGANGWDVSS